MITVRPVQLAADKRIEPTEYDLLAPWWQARGGEAPSREMLPGMGGVAEINGKPIACAFMYLDATGSGVAWLAWLATCPATSAHRVGRAMRHLFEFLQRVARDLDYWLVNATFHHPSLVSVLKRLGFQTADTGMTQLFKPLQN